MSVDVFLFWLNLVGHCEVCDFEPVRLFSDSDVLVPCHGRCDSYSRGVYRHVLLSFLP